MDHTLPSVDELVDQGLVKYDRLVPGTIITCFEGYKCCACIMNTEEHDNKIFQFISFGGTVTYRGGTKVITREIWKVDHESLFENDKLETAWRVVFLPRNTRTFKTWVRDQVSVKLGKQ